MHRVLSLAIVLVMGVAAFAKPYDLESDVGCVAYVARPDIARRNTVRLNAWLARMSQLPKDPTGKDPSVLDRIHAAGKIFYFAGTIETNIKTGGCLEGAGGTGYPLPVEQYAGGMGGAHTIFIQTDPTAESLIRLRGSGFKLSSIHLWGLVYAGDSTGAGPELAKRGKIGIEVEGRVQLASGHHVIEDVTCLGFIAGIRCRAGYWKEGEFVADENHAECGVCDRVRFWCCDSCFKSDNQQARPWKFRDLVVSGFDGVNRCRSVVLDVVRGGHLTVEGCTVLNWETVVIRVEDWSPYTCSLVVRDLLWDHIAAPSQKNYLTLFEFAGATYPEDQNDWLKWRVRIDGHLLNAPKEYDSQRLVIVPRNFTTANLKFDVLGLPERGFHWSDGFQVPNPKE